MKKRWFKTWSLSLIGLILATSLLSIGGVSTGEVKAAASTTKVDQSDLEWKKDTSPFTFRQYFYGSWATVYLWKDQFCMNYIKEKTGVTIDRFLATGNDDDYLNTMIAADDLPDSLMLDWNKPVVTKLIRSGMLYSLTELINKYCPKLWSMLDKEMVQYHSVDGKLWYLPNFYATKESATAPYTAPGIPIRPWFVRKDIYEALGKPKLGTPNELIAAMKLAKKKYPDISPLGLEKFDVNSEGFRGSRSMDFIIYAYAPNLEKERIKDSKKLLEYPMRNPGFINAFRFINKLQREGLFDPQLLIYKQEQYEEKLYGAKYFIASQFVNNIYEIYNLKIENTLGPDKTYLFAEPIKVDGKDPQYPNQRSMGWQGFFITKKAKNPERIIKFLEYGWSDEGQMDFRYGKLGVTYDLESGGPRKKPEIEELQKTNNAAYNAKYGFDQSTLLWRAGELWDKMYRGELQEKFPGELDCRTRVAKYNQDIYSLGIDNIEPEGSTPEGVINAKIKDIWNKTIPKLVLAKTDAGFNTVYKDFIAQINKVGAAKVEKAMYLRHMEDLKKKGLAK